MGRFIHLYFFVHNLSAQLISSNGSINISRRSFCHSKEPKLRNRIKSFLSNWIDFDNYFYRCGDQYYDLEDDHWFGYLLR